MADLNDMGIGEEYWKPEFRKIVNAQRKHSEKYKHGFSKSGREFNRLWLITPLEDIYNKQGLKQIEFKREQEKLTKRADRLNWDSSKTGRAFYRLGQKYGKFRR